MNTETLTEKIYAKSDAELKKKIADSVAWIWNETGHTGIKPDANQLSEINGELRGSADFKEFEAMPWIGAATKRFEVIAFHYLRNKYRSQAIYDFMQKVESISEITSQ